MAATSGGTIRIEIKLDTEPADKGLSTLTESLNKFSSKAVEALQQAATTAVDLGTQFEDSVAKISTLTAGSTASIDSIGDGLLKVSTETGVAADEMGAALYQALAAGVPAGDDMSQALAFLEQSAELAKGGFTDMETAVDVSTSVMNDYGMCLEDVDGIQKVLIQTQNKGGVAVDELAQSLSNVTPTAAALGIGFDEVGASIATMAAQGASSEEATASLNSLFEELSNTSSTTSESLAAATEAAFGSSLSFSELLENGYNVSDIMQLLADYADDTGVSMDDLVGSQEAVQAALQLTGENAATYSENLAAMSTETDVVGESADRVASTVSERFNAIINEGENALIAFYTEGIQPAAIALADLFAWLTDPENQTAATIVGIAIGTLTAAIVAFTIAQNLAAIASAAFAVVAFATFPITLIIVALGALIAIIYALVTNWDAVKAAAATAVEVIQEVWGNVVAWFTDTVVTPLGAVFETFSAFFATLKEKAASVWEGIQEVWGNVVTWFTDTVVTPLSAVFETFGGFFTTLKDSIVGIWTELSTSIKNIINTMIGGIEGFANGIINGVNTVIGALNSLQIDVPDWMEELTGISSFGFCLQPLSPVAIPRLARGAVIPPNREFLAVLGDNRNGRNLEAPEGLIRDIVNDALAKNQSATNVNVEFSGTLAQLARVLNPAIKVEQSRIGTSMVKVGAV